MSDTISEPAVCNLANDLLAPIALHMRTSEASCNTQVMESLNALAFAVAVVLRGTHEDPVARRFFETALNQQLLDFRATGHGNDS